MSDDQYGSYPSLVGKAVVISGGASGIGEALVRAFASQGSKVGFVDVLAALGKRLESELLGGGSSTKFIECDVTNIERYRSAIRELESAHGPTSVLLNNAANDQRLRWHEVTPELWEAGLSVNLRHAFFAAQVVSPGMIAAGGGSIINFGSISWLIMVPNLTPYTACKAAMHGLSRSLAKELGPHGIRVNTLVPGWIMTDRQLTNWVGEEEERLIRNSQALAGRLYPADIARMALFLAADDSRMISGQDFVVDGGWAHA